VLLKGFSADGFVFFTNLSSRKGRALAAEPRIALLFPWHDLERQVRVEGSAALLTRAEVEAYFSSRPRGSQLGAWASHQSSVVGGRDELDAAYAAVEERFADRDVPVPEEWGGYRVTPTSVEFWQGRVGRMHDRLVYRRTADGWATERLAP
jgi:pyridoxamine 5'-phosphate oxidase